jgi:hypothetical protein
MDMPKYIVVYNVNVDVLVNTDDNTVEKVVIDNEGTLMPTGEIIDFATLEALILDEPAKKRITDIADGGDGIGDPGPEWPTWDWGW